MSSERFTDATKDVLRQAAAGAAELRHEHIGTEHLVYALCGDHAAGKVLSTLGVNRGAVLGQIGRQVGTGRGAKKQARQNTTHLSAVLDQGALREALQLGHNYVGPEHLLLAVVRQAGTGDVGAQILVELGLEPSRVRDAIMHELNGYRPPASLGEEVADQPNVATEAEAREDELNDFLAREGIDGGVIVVRGGRVEYMLLE